MAATPEETQKLVMTMVTDPQRMRRTDPGNPDVCNVFSMHKVFSTKEEVDMVNVECRRAGIGCVDCKKMLARNLNAHLAPFREKRNALAENPSDVWDVLYDGARRARVIAEQTMVEVRDAIGMAKNQARKNTGRGRCRGPAPNQEPCTQKTRPSCNHREQAGSEVGCGSRERRAGNIRQPDVLFPRFTQDRL
jgi:hypothetical protein